MRVTIQNLEKVLSRHRSGTESRKELMRHVFSFQCNFDTFCYYFFAGAVTAAIPDFHREIYDFLFSMKDEAMAAPRGHAKSTLVGMMFIAYCVVNKLEKYIVYISQSFQKTMQFIKPLAMEFMRNADLIYVYGDLTPRKTRDNLNKFRQDIIDVNGIRIQAASFEKNIRGFKFGNQRPTLIVLDDIEGDERTSNADLRLKDEHKLNKVIIPALDPICGKIKMIGTILHWDSLLIKKIRQYKGKIFKAISDDLDPETILWPEYFSYEILMAKRDSIGTVAFSSEYLNNPVENEASLIRQEWIRSCFDPTISFGDAQEGIYDLKYLGCDFAFGDRALNDKSAYIGLGMTDKTYTITQLVTYKGLSITEQFDILELDYINFGYNQVVMEENSIKSMTKELNNYKFKSYLIWTAGSDPAKKFKDTPEFEQKRHSVGKKAMILRLATQFENKNIKIPYKTEEDQRKAHQLMDECMTYALNDGQLVEVGIHGDLPIALCMALERFNSRKAVFKW